VQKPGKLNNDMTIGRGPRIRFPSGPTSFEQKQSSQLMESTHAMKILIRGLLCVLLLSQSSSVSMASPQQDTATKHDQSPAAFDPKSTLEDGTPVKLRISQTVSSADAHKNDRVEFEVLEEIKVADTLIIPKGGIA
jgi:hypothetical protein